MLRKHKEMYKIHTFIEIDRLFLELVAVNKAFKSLN